MEDLQHVLADLPTERALGPIRERLAWRLTACRSVLDAIDAIDSRRDKP